MATALARPSIDNLPQPVSCGIIDGLSNVEAKVKSTVISATENYHDFMLFVL